MVKHDMATIESCIRVLRDGFVPSWAANMDEGARDYFALGVLRAEVALIHLEMEDANKYRMLVEAYGEERAEQLIVQAFGTISDAFDYAVSEGIIDISKGE